MREDIFNPKYIRSLAIMGGTFDPIHYGHLVAAETVRQEYNVDKVIFIPSGNPPHKTTASMNENDKMHRYLMTVAATLDNAYFDVSTMEIDRPGYTYTIDTITEIRKVSGDDLPIYFIMGSDSLLEIMTWKKPEKPFTLCDIVVLSRSGYTSTEVLAQIEKLKTNYKAKIRLLEMPPTVYHHLKSETE